MARRPGAGDRHALLSSSAYPSSGLYPRGQQGNDSYRTVSPFEQPYGGDTSDPYAEYGVGAPKKEPALYGNDKSTGQKLSQFFGMQTADQLEEQNDERLEGLNSRVKLLKDITIGIGTEVKDSTKDLDSLGEVFSNTSAFLGNTFNRMNHMARRQGGWFCNMMMFLLFVIWIFIFLWWWRR